MKNITLIAFLSAIGFLTACKKNGGTDANGNPNKLKWYIENAVSGGSNVTDSFSVSYDNNNRLIALSSPQLKLVYAYPSSKTFTLDLYEYGQLDIHEIAYINSASLLDSTFQYNNTYDTTTEKYIYNGNLLMREITYDYSGHVSAISSQDDYTYDNNGNMIKDVNSDGFGNINYMSIFTYTDKPTNVLVTPTYYPQPSKFLPATQQLADGGGNVYAVVNYTYVFDSSGRLTKETDTDTSGDVDTKTYVYQ
jgi:hypothetical protein